MTLKSPGSSFPHACASDLSKASTLTLKDRDAVSSTWKVPFGTWSLSRVKGSNGGIKGSLGSPEQHAQAQDKRDDPHAPGRVSETRSLDLLKVVAWRDCLRKGAGE